MPVMTRRLLNLLTALSLLLCILVAALWVRSHWMFDEVYWLRPAQTNGHPSYDVRRVASGRGRLSFTYFRSSGMQDGSELSMWAAGGDWSPRVKSYPALPVTADPAGVCWSGAGFSIQNLSGDPYRFAFFRRLTLPTWLLAVVPLSSLLASTARRLRRQRRRNRGACVSCGYDLRATLDRCPECGVVREIPMKPAASNPLEYAAPNSARRWRTWHTWVVGLVALTVVISLWHTRGSWAFLQGPPGIRYDLEEPLVAAAVVVAGAISGLCAAIAIVVPAAIKWYGELG